MVLLSPKPSQLLTGAKDHELGDLHPIRAEFTPQFVKCELNGGRFSDRVARSSGRHRPSVTPVHTELLY
jgi:hypothetical protein